MKGPDEETWLIVEMATSLWRIRMRAIGSGEDQGCPELRGIIREIESVWDRMADADLEIIDHTGEPYDPGKSLEVIAFQPTPGVSDERVIETYRPTIYHGSRQLQMAQVVISIPVSPSDPSTGSDS